MGRPRSQLHQLLKSITTNVYFQPPANIVLSYPCIIYNRDRARTNFADNSPYQYTKKYQIKVIDRDPGSTIPDKVSNLPMCLHDRFYTADNLNHDVFNIFF